jgi:hypothetical protein
MILLLVDGEAGCCGGVSYRVDGVGGGDAYGSGGDRRVPERVLEDHGFERFFFFTGESKLIEAATEYSQFEGRAVGEDLTRVLGSPWCLSLQMNYVKCLEKT